MSSAVPRDRRWRAVLGAAWMLVAGLWSAPVAAGVAAVEVRVARHEEGFGRLVLDWPEPASLRVERLEDGLRIHAPSPFRADFDEARHVLSPWLSAIDEAPDGDVLTLHFEPEVRAERLDYAPNLLVLDLRAPRAQAAGPDAAPPEPVVRIGRHDGFTRLVLDWAAPIQARIERGPHELRLTLDRPFEVDLATLRMRLEGLVDRLERAGARQLRLRLAPNVAADPFTLDDDKLVIDLHASANAPAPGAGVALVTTSAQRGQAARPEPVVAAPNQPEEPPSVRIDASRLEGGFELGFTWPEPVPAAIFVRGAALWAVFDGISATPPPEPRPWQIGALTRVLGPSEQIPLDGALALRFPLKVPTQVHVERDGPTWRVRLGPTAPVAHEVTFDRAGPQGLALRRSDAGGLVEVVDPEVGDRVGIWPLLEPGGVLHGRRLVHVEILPSAQGVVWSHRSDRLGVLAGRGELVLAPAARPVEGEPRPTILQAGWLAASDDDAADLSAAPLPSNRDGETPAAAAEEALPRPPPPKPDRRMSARAKSDAAAPPRAKSAEAKTGSPARADPAAQGADPAAPGSEMTAEAPPEPFLDLARFAPDPGVGLVERKAKAMARVARAPPEDRRAAQLDLARFLLAHALAAEAMGVLIDTGPVEEGGGVRGSQKALWGAAAFLINRFEDAAEALSDPVFDGDAEVALWRAATAGERDEWERATRSLAAAGDTLETYPPALRLPLGLALARIEARAGHAMNAFAILEQLRRAQLPAADRRRVAFTQGQVYAEVGAIDAAAETWRALENASRDRTALEAGFAWRTLSVDAGRLEPEEALEALLPLRAAWRGHPGEARQLATLARLHARTGRVAEAIRLWQEALSRGADEALAGSIETAKRGALVEALEHGGDDWVGPLRAYALYQDFRQLVPTGRDGVRVRRSLAQRLASIDQLDPAGELLAEALAMSPPGEGRSTVGAELAELWLRYPDPGRALDALGSSAGADLPATLRRQRALLSARAEKALGEHAAALAALDGLDDGMDHLEAKRLRAQILFDGARWGAFRVAVRPLLEAEQDIPPAEQRAWLVRLAIALREDGDRTRLAELRRDAVARVAGTSHGPPFHLATATSEPGSASPASAIDAAERQIEAARRYLETF